MNGKGISVLLRELEKRKDVRVSVLANCTGIKALSSKNRVPAHFAHDHDKILTIRSATETRLMISRRILIYTSLRLISTELSTFAEPSLGSFNLFLKCVV